MNTTLMKKRMILMMMQMKLLKTLSVAQADFKAKIEQPSTDG
jgi:hypothetical protein